MNKKAVKITKRIFSILGIILFCAVMVALVSIAIQLFSGKEPSLFGYRFYYILTDSMTPELKSGDVVLSRQREDVNNISDLKVGDVVTFVGVSGTQTGMTITHRIVKAPYFSEELSAHAVVTRGDKAGAGDDPPVPIANVKAVMKSKAHLMSALGGAIKMPLGFVFLVVAPVLLVIALLILRLAFTAKRKRKVQDDLAEKARIEEVKRLAVEEYKLCQKDGEKPSENGPE